MNESTRYAKIVEWSVEDQCFVGSSPGLIYGGCHGPNERAVFEQLCRVVDETIAIYHQDGPPRRQITAAAACGAGLREQDAERRLTDHRAVDR